MPSVEPKWLVNGSESSISPTDRGLAYGDGLFETMAAQNGRIRWLDHHLERMSRDCRRLRIPCPPRELLEAEIAAICPPAGKAVVKLILTRGVGARGYRPPDPTRPTRIVMSAPWPDYPNAYYTQGVPIRVCTTRVAENPMLAGIKHLCRLEQVMAQIELAEYSEREGLQLTLDGRIVGGTMSNVFMVSSGTLATPKLDRCGVLGVMRAVTLERARENGWKINERDIVVDELYAADEIFLTNAVFGIWPVCRLEEHLYSVGEKTRSLMSLLPVGTCA